MFQICYQDETSSTPNVDLKLSSFSSCRKRSWWGPKYLQFLLCRDTRLLASFQVLLLAGEKLPAFEHEANVSNGSVNRQQLPVEGAVAWFRQNKLHGEEGERGPKGAAKMLQDSAHVGVGDIDHQANGEVSLGAL